MHDRNNQSELSCFIKYFNVNLRTDVLNYKKIRVLMNNICIIIYNDDVNYDNKVLVIYNDENVFLKIYILNKFVIGISTSKFFLTSNNNNNIYY